MEFMTAGIGADYLVWGSQLLTGMRVSHDRGELVRNAEASEYAHEPIPLLYQDNRSSIHLINQSHGNFKNTKHIKVRYYYIRELVKAGEIVVQWVPTLLMVADILSKGVTWSVFSVLLPMLIGTR
jgi:hypothetical protein